MGYLGFGFGILGSRGAARVARRGLGFVRPPFSVSLFCFLCGRGRTTRRAWRGPRGVFGETLGLGFFWGFWGFGGFGWGALPDFLEKDFLFSLCAFFVFLCVFF